MQNAFSTLEENIFSAVKSMPSEFDTHQLILELARENQQAYIKALHESDSDTPFQAVHSKIGKALKRYSLEENAVIRETEANCKSPNIFGEYSSCSKWERLN